ncbi:ERF family protein [Metabacillus sp. GX 13764]|uniref:ERF family protein n=1 Tax=Metabacillus kandeliae TaxID=2900151 RepID=UPI001E2F8F8A|nr:ERF family protein [Metabacillus kandeliae]MCD7034338.1 ERF family protein [Metabacillus kandeliae]
MSEAKLNLFQKLVEVRKSVPYLKKESQGHQYQYTGSSQVLASVRAKMDELGVMLLPKVIAHNLIEGKTDKGKKEYMTELEIEFTWINADNPSETFVSTWYGQGVDNAEKGVGKALTYAEKYYMLKTFNIATDKDDPDAFQEKAESYRKPDTISTEQIGTLKTKVLEFAKLRGKADKDVYAALKVNDVTKLTAQSAEDAIGKLESWITKAKEEKSA